MKLFQEMVNLFQVPIRFPNVNPMTRIDVGNLDIFHQGLDSLDVLTGAILRPFVELTAHPSTGSG